MSIVRQQSAARPGYVFPGTHGRALEGLIASKAAFTMVELQVVITIMAVLAAMLLPSLSRAKDNARSSHCLDQMRQIILAARCYVEDNDDLFPRSQHSAFANGQLPWERALAPTLGVSDAAWTNLLSGVYHCLADSRPDHLSYGMNNYFELGPEDDYPENPQTFADRPARQHCFFHRSSHGRRPCHARGLDIRCRRGSGFGLDSAPGKIKLPIC